MEVGGDADQLDLRTSRILNSRHINSNYAETAKLHCCHLFNCYGYTGSNTSLNQSLTVGFSKLKRIKNRLWKPSLYV